MPAYRDALIEQADAAGLASDEASLMQLALGKVGPAAEGSGDGAKSAAEQYVEASDAANALADELMGLLDSYNELNGIGQSSEQQNAALQTSFAGLQEYVEQAQAGVDGYSLSLDGSSAAGAANRAMLADHAAAVKENADAQFELESVTLGVDAATASYQQRLADGRQQILDTGTALSGNAEEAQTLTDKLLAMPNDKEIAILMETATAKSELDALTAPRSIDIFFKTGMAPASPEWRAPMKAPASANGNLFEFANGGGLETGIYSGGPPITRFAESETGWESFISGKPSERDRNRQIWAETGERLGMKDVLKLMGSAGQQGGGSSVSLTVNPTPGMSESEVGRIAADKVTFALGG